MWKTIKKIFIVLQKIESRWCILKQRWKLVLVNDLDLGYSEEDLLSLSAKDLYNELENKIDFDLYFEALDIKQQNEPVLEDDENELGGM